MLVTMIMNHKNSKTFKTLLDSYEILNLSRFYFVFKDFSGLRKTESFLKNFQAPCLQKRTCIVSCERASCCEPRKRKGRILVGPTLETGRQG